jgi:sugar phosphate isomerase/epimerase
VTSTRRQVLAGAAFALAAGKLSAFKSHITKTRLSAITDAVGKTQADAIDFAKHYGLQWVELRNVPETKKEFTYLSEPELKAAAAELASNKLKVSFLDTSLLKFAWPGLVPADAAKEPDQKRWDRRKDDFAAALRAANILGAEKIRIFTGARVAHPETAYPMVVRTLEELIPDAEKAKVKLLIQNEESQNVGTSAEVKAIMELLPSKTIGFNWDPGDAQFLKESPWPEGYALLPKNRMMNVQFKTQNLLDGPEKLNWRAILEAMQKDNYQGELGLETHVPADTLIDKAHECMKEMMHIVGELS